jgi:hypothetical protein
MNDQKEKRKLQKLTNENFLKVCDFLRNNHEEVVKNAHSYFDVAMFCKLKTGLEVGLASIASCCKAVNIKLEFKKKDPNKSARNNTRVLATSLLRLYKKLGEEPPAQLVEMVDRLNHGQGFANSPPIPVSSVVDPKLVPVVNVNNKR